MPPLKPSDISTPAPGRDPGVRASPIRVQDPRPEAMAQLGAAQAQFGRQMAALGDAALRWHKQRQEAEDGIGVDTRELEFSNRMAAYEAETFNNPDPDPQAINRFDSRASEIAAEVDAEFSEKYPLSRNGQRRWQQSVLNRRTSSGRLFVIQQNNARVTQGMETLEANTDRIAIGEGDIDSKLARVDASIESAANLIPYDKHTEFRQAQHLKVYSAHLNTLSKGAVGAAQRGDYATAAELLADAKRITDKLQGTAPLETPEEVPGLQVEGNIDLASRPVVTGEDGRPMTVKSMSVNIDGREVLIPTIADGRELTPEQAVNRYMVTKEHLGIFDNAKDATAYAKKLSEQQEAVISGKVPRAVATPAIAAAKAKGIDPVVYLGLMWIESKFNPMAKNPDSSAAGLLQFISSTGQNYNLPPDARAASITDQVNAGAELTSDGILRLRQEFGTEPTPGEIYLAHFLGEDAAVRVLRADPGTPLSKLISADAIKKNKMAGWNAADIQQWADGKMQVAMEYVTDGGFIEGRKVGPNAAGLPIDKALSLSQFVNSTETEIRRLHDAELKEYQKMVDPGLAPKERDGAGYVAKKYPEVQEAFRLAQKTFDSIDADADDKRTAYEAAIDASIEAQMALPGYDETMVKVLPNKLAQERVQWFKDHAGPEGAGAFKAYMESMGKHRDRAFDDLVLQGLPATYQFLNELDATGRASEFDVVAQGLDLDQNELTKRLGTTSGQLKADVINPIEDALSEWRANFEAGGPVELQGVSRAYMDAAINAGLIYLRQKPTDPQGAVNYAVGIIENTWNTVTAENVRAIVPARFGLSDADIEDAASAAQAQEVIEKFNPDVIGGLVDLGPEFDKESILNSASNKGFWRTNENDDGLVLMVRFGAGTAAVPLIKTLPNGKKERYEIKYEDIPELARVSRMTARETSTGRPRVAEKAAAQASEISEFVRANIPADMLKRHQQQVAELKTIIADLAAGRKKKLTKEEADQIAAAMNLGGE